MLKTISTAGTVCSSLVASGCGTGLDTHVRESLARVSLQIIFILPYPAAAIRAWLGPLGKEVLPNPTSVVVAVGLVLWVGVFPHHVRKFRIESGFKISDSLFPAGSTRFLARAKPEPQIFTTFTYGHYLTWNLREYPVFVDTRETMYRHLQTRILDAYNNAEAAHAIYRDFGINAVLVPIPKTRYIPEVGGWEDVTSVVPARLGDRLFRSHLGRGASAHASESKIIEQNEFRILRPNLPSIFTSTPRIEKSKATVSFSWNWIAAWPTNPRVRFA